MKCAGIDIGSRTIKLVVFDGDRVVLAKKMENSFDTLRDCRQMLDGISYDVITSTGYGRHIFAQNFEKVNVVSEIKAFSVGVNHLFPTCGTVLDIGGQDTKAIAIDGKGRICKFEMNDKCAAGTGRFLEIMSMALRCPLADFGMMAASSKQPVKINNMCTVFAESEVISLLAKGVQREDIACGILQSIISRGVSQLKRVGINGDVAFVGGVALNSTMVKLLGDALSCPILTPSDPQIVGAMGAALCGGAL